jgi:hypothetical protein
MNKIEAARAIATRQHARRGKFEIDPGCEIAAVPTGIWVQAWVFVGNADIDAEMASKDFEETCAHAAAHYLYRGSER